MRDLALATAPQWARRVSIMQHERAAARHASRLLNTLVQEGALAAVHIEGLKDVYYMPIEDYALLETLERGNVPDAWNSPAYLPHAAATTEEVNFLAPLDNVIWDRARTKELFDFEYVWEVYKPAATRKWGYYTLPILYGDQLVGRIAPRLDRKTRALYIEGFWLESEEWREHEAFRRALNAGLTRLARFHNAARLDTSAVANQNPACHVMLDNIAAHYTA